MHLFRLRISSLTPAPKPTQYTLLLIQSEAKQTVIFHLTPPNNSTTIGSPISVDFGKRKSQYTVYINSILT